MQLSIIGRIRSELGDPALRKIAAEAGGGVLLTSDAGDLGRLAAPYRSILVQRLI